MKTLTLKTALTQLSLIGRIAIIAGLAIASSPVSAEFYAGDAYGARVSINATLVGVGATIVDNPNLPLFGSNVALTNQLLNADVEASATGTPVNAFAVLQADTINTSTIGTGSVATSFAQIENLSLFPDLSLSVPNPLSELFPLTLNLTSLVTADLIRSTTTADEFG
ncbi:MAG: hypothetical protein H8F28_15900, partial [Fibrella sp.]|nr:hypothetical protein [Armatimonadota bacterium]